jgi:hypothetical protein
MKKNLGTASILLCALALFPSCHKQEPGSDRTISDEAAIYAASIRRLATVDDMLPSLDLPTLFVVQNTDERAGNPLAPLSETRPIRQRTREEIAAALADLHAKIVWIGEKKDAPLEEPDGTDVLESHRRVKNGAVFSLGNIHPIEGGAVRVGGSITFAGLDAYGGMYVLKKVVGVWRIDGKLWPKWVS